MRPIGLALAAAVLAGAVGSSCATAVDLDSVNSRIEGNQRRIEALERTQRSADPGIQQRLGDVEKEIEALRKDFADSRFSLGELSEKLESFQAYLQEVEQYLNQFRKRGGEIDKALEEMANRLEAELRRMGEKVREMMKE